MRTFWLRSPEGAVWNLTPENPYSDRGGCFFNNARGLGYENAITQTQVNFDYFIDSVLSKNKNISGTLYFNSDNHVDNFYDFVRDFSRTFELHYSPDGRIIATDQLSASWYKPCVITLIDKNEKNSALWYEVPITITTQADVWRRDISVISGTPETFGQPHVYPYFYTYFYGGQGALAIDINNTGSTVSPVIEIMPTGESPITDPLWTREYKYTDIYGIMQSEPQRARFNIILRPNMTLLVDSRALVGGKSAQRAVVLNTAGEPAENVFSSQETDFDYINFIDLPKGDNRIIFTLGTTEVKIKISYTEQRELI